MNFCLFYRAKISNFVEVQFVNIFSYGLYFCQIQGHENLLLRFLLKVLWFYILHTYDPFWVRVNFISSRFNFFAYWIINCFNTICWKVCCFSIEFLLNFCQKTIDHFEHIYMDLVLDSVFYSTDQYTIPSSTPHFVITW